MLIVKYYVIRNLEILKRKRGRNSTRSRTEGLLKKRYRAPGAI